MAVHNPSNMEWLHEFLPATAEPRWRGKSAVIWSWPTDSTAPVGILGQPAAGVFWKLYRYLILSIGQSAFWTSFSMLIAFNSYCIYCNMAIWVVYFIFRHTQMWSRLTKWNLMQQFDRYPAKLQQSWMAFMEALHLHCTRANPASARIASVCLAAISLSR